MDGANPTGPPAARVPMPGGLVTARYVRRPNRFVVCCRLEETGEEVAAHLPDPGRLTGLLEPERPVQLRPEDGEARKTEWTAVLVRGETPEGWVSVDTTLPNRLVEQALRAGDLEEFGEWSLERPEVRLGGSRFDFLLSSADGRRMALEVKSVTLVREKTGLFPDAVTARGARHVRELGELAERREWEASLLFVVQRPDAGAVAAARDIDPEFADALAEARRRGVSAHGRRCRVDLDAVRLGGRIPVR